MPKIELDFNEKEILNSYEAGEWQPVAYLEQEIQAYSKLAQATNSILSDSSPTNSAPPPHRPSGESVV